jgi:SAM-dependent methyltransferase
MPGYEADLAFIHDRGFGAFAQESAPELLRILRRHQVRSGLVVDLGCGSGIWAAELIAAGYDALGVDLSPAMIRLARKRAPQSRFVIASIYDVPLPSCRAVTATSECLNYTFDRRSGERQLRPVVAAHPRCPGTGRVTHLRPRGSRAAARW